MSETVSRTFYIFSLLLISILVVGGGFLSFSYRDDENLDQAEAQTDEKSSVLNSSVQNATYSAVPLIEDKIVSEKQAQPTMPSIITTSKGDHLLVLVNKSISLGSGYYPNDLVGLNSLVTSYPGAQLRTGAATQLVKMFAAAKNAGYNLTVTSAYRSYSTQQATFNYWVSVAGLAAASQISARPGHSQHQLGTAVDLSATTISNNLTPNFGNTPEGKWLADNSYKWGYVLSYPAGKEHITGYAYEPWHFRYIGVTAAGQMNSLGWDLETYLQNYGVW